MQALDVEKAMRDGPHPVPKERLFNYYSFYLGIVSQEPMSVSENNNLCQGTASTQKAVSCHTNVGASSADQLPLSKENTAKANAVLQDLLHCNLISQVTLHVAT